MTLAETISNPRLKPFRQVIAERYRPKVEEGARFTKEETEAFTPYEFLRHDLPFYEQLQAYTRRMMRGR